MGEINSFPIDTVTWDEANISLPSGGGGSGASYFPIYCTDRLTPISLETVGELDNIMDWMVPFSLSVSTIHASLSNPATTGTFTIDILRNGVSVLSTLLTIDAGEANSTTAAVPAIISDFDWNMGDTITVAVTDDADGTASGLKLYITTGAVAADTTSPDVPTGLGATVISHSQVDLDCDDATDNVGVTGYQFQRATNSGFSSGVVSFSSTTSNVSITGLSGSTAYYFRVRAKDAAGNFSGWSSSVNATTSSAPASDTDVLAFLSASGITDPTIAGALDNLVIAMKADGIWTKMLAIYPFVGGTASTHKWNLKDPRDLDAAYRLTFTGGLTHSSTGVLPNGSSGFADTKLAGSALTNNSTHLSFYSRTNTVNDGMSIGVTNAGASAYHHLSIRHSAGFLTDAYDAGTRIINANADSLGLHAISRESNVLFKQWKDGAQVGVTQTGANSIDITTVAVNHYIFARNNNGTADSFAPYECAFASIGAALTDADNAALDTAVAAFETALSRNV